jgi:hypothetical protein
MTMDILKIVSGHGEEVQDQFVSKIEEYSAAIDLNYRRKDD